MEMRAYKRQHYFKRSHDHYYNTDPHKKPFEDNIYEETMEIEDMLRDLDIKEDEKTFEYKEKVLKFQNEEKALHEINKISRHVKSLKNISVNGMESILKTVSSVDEQSQKLLLRSFNRQNANQFSYKAPVYRS
jgi:hypothetical protein